MNTYGVTLIGETPLLLHQDSIEWREQMDLWIKDPQNKKASKAGDDRFPAHRWIGCCYYDGQHVGIASDNLMTMLREGGAKVPTGKKGQTFKRQSQSGLVVNEILWPLVTSNGPVPWAPIAAMATDSDFANHKQAVQALGFELFVKGAKIGASKHIRVRPRFDTWSAAGTITVLDETITQGILQQILEQAGMFCGLGDWRPSSPSKPGSWGRFRAEVKRLK
jgi:hypothetical protein